MLTKLLFLVAAFYPPFFQLQIGPVCVYQIYLAIATLWLFYLLFQDFIAVVQGKRLTDASSGTEESRPLKNLFVVFLLGYLVLEMTSIESYLVEDSVYLYFAFLAATLLFAHVICSE